MTTTNKALTNWQFGILLVTRMIIGWHFLYEGIVKLINPEWTSAGYLLSSRWIFSGVFHNIATNESVLQFVDFLNVWGLILIGLALITGLFVRVAAFSGIALLALYYIANPPFIETPGAPLEGSYLIVNKNVVEIFALLIVAAFPTSLKINISFSKFKGLFTGFKRSYATAGKSLPEEDYNRRREMLKGLTALPFMGAFAYALGTKASSNEEKNLLDAMTGASVKTINLSSLKDLKGDVGKGKIKEKEFSRLILGGNLLSGWAHSRDLIYVSQLVRAYHTKEKIFGTLLMAEKCGINTLLTNPVLAQLINEYWDRNIGNIQFISDCAGLTYDDKGRHAMPFNQYMDKIQEAIDRGACACYIQGETADFYMQNGLEAQLEKAVQKLVDNNVVWGIGAHHIETIKACVDAGFDPDFWMKTLHHLNYWSAGHKEWHDNKYCFKPEDTINYMESLEQPWIAFKVMAAGSIHPKEAFRYAFEKGADFVCAGMYDFQMVEDVNIAYDVLQDKSLMNRKRTWRA